MARNMVRQGRLSLAALAVISLMVVAASIGGAKRSAPAEPFAEQTVVAPGSAAAAIWSPDAINAAARALPRLRSLLVSRGGELVFEGNYNGTRANRLVNIKSASKSIISALVGIAIDRDIIPGVQT